MKKNTGLCGRFGSLGGSLCRRGIVTHAGALSFIVYRMSLSFFALLLVLLYFYYYFFLVFLFAVLCTVFDHSYDNNFSKLL